MTVDLVVRLRAEGDLEFVWRGELRQGSDAREILRERSQTASAGAPTACVLLPTERVLCSAVSVPARSRRQLERALPFAVEERLASDLDGVHIVPVSLQVGAPTAVRIVSVSVLQGALASLGALGWNVVSLQSEADRVACRGDLTLLFEADRVLAKDRTGRSLAFDRSALDLVLPLLCSGLRSEPSAMLQVTAQVIATSPLSGLEQSLLVAECGAEPTILPLGDAFDAIGQSSVNGVELLTGVFAPRRQNDTNWQRWRPPAIAAGVLALLLPAVDVARGLWLTQRGDDLERQAYALYAKANPGEAVPRDLRRTLRLSATTSEEAGGAPSVGFRPLLTALADVAAKAPKFELQGIAYQYERDELAVQLFATSMVELDAFRGAFGSHGVVAELSSAEQEEARVRARLRIHAPKEAS